VSLTVDYKARVPLDAVCRSDCWVEKRDGRKLFLRGHIRLPRSGNEKATAGLATTASGIFLELRPKL